MIKHRQNKPQELTRGDGKSGTDREASMLTARREAESKASVFLEERDIRLQKRKAAVADAKAGGDWLQISKIIKNVVKKEGAKFDDDRRSKIEKAICDDIVLHFSDEGSGIQQSEIFMLLSKDYDKTELTPSQLAQALKTGFDRIYGDEKRQEIAKFLIAHGWMKRAAASKWLGPDIPLPRHIWPAQESILKTKAADKAKCLNWLKSEMQASKERTKKVVFQEAKHKFKVTVRTFSALWNQAINETESYEWRKPGRPKKS